MKLYPLNTSQEIVDLQTKYSLFRRVANILFSTTVEEGFDRELMHKAIDKTIERNDCLRLTFVKKDKKILQYFVPERTIGSIPEKDFRSASEMEAFLRKFRRSEARIFKGRPLEVVFAKNPDRKDIIIFKISHYVADTYGIGTIVGDLFAVYRALASGSELPPAPGSFEKLLEKEMEYKADTSAFEKDRQFFEEYYTKRHPEHPVYCGIHGNGSDRWLKQKAKGRFSMPYLFVKCDTEGYRFVLPSSLVREVGKWCEESGVTMSCFFCYICAVAASKLNDNAPYQIPLELLNNRGTLAERKAAGTKVQVISLYTIVDHEKSFKENLMYFNGEQSEFYRHTKMTYLEVQTIQHEFWKYSLLSQMSNFCFSFIPFSTPDGVTMQIHSNGKGALTAYIAMMLDVKTGQVFVNYDIQTKMTTPAQLADFQNLCVQITEKVIAQPDKKLSEIL